MLKKGLTAKDFSVMLSPMKDQILAALKVENLSTRNIRERFGVLGIAAAQTLVDERKIFAGFDGFSTEYSLKPIPVYLDDND